jgi:hypothetical protein
MNILPKRRIKNPASQQEIATTNRNTRKAYSLIAATLIPFPAYGLLSKVIGRSTAMGAKKMGDNIRFTKGMTMSGIKSAFKKAGSIGNTKKPDTVGNRLRQAQAIMGTSRTGKSMDGFPTKVKTKSAVNKKSSIGGTSKGSLLFQNKTLKQSVEEANKKARAALGKRSSGNNPKTGIRAGKRVFGKEQSEGYAYGYDYSLKGNSVNATKYTAYDTIKGKKNIDKANRARKELSKGLPKGQIDYDPKHVREKFFQKKSLSNYDIKLDEDSYPSNIIKKARSLLRRK